MELISLDLATEWEPCANGLGIRFAKWDVNDGEGVLKATRWEKIDLAVISYVLYHYMSNGSGRTRTHAAARPPSPCACLSPA